MPSSEVTDFDFSSDGRMWVSTGNGLAVYDLNTKRIITYKKEDGLQNTNIRSVAVDQNDIVWCFTPSGLIRYDGESFTMYTQEDGLVRPRGQGDVNIDKKGNS